MATTISSRSIRDTIVLAKIETTPRVDAVPTGAANAMLVGQVDINWLEATNVDRPVAMPFMGKLPQLVGSAYATVTFDIELVGSGIVGVAPAWGALLRGIGFAEVVTEDERVDYTLLTTGMETVTLYVYDSGTLHKIVGARGTAVLKYSMGGTSTASFNFMGTTAAPTVATAGSVDLTHFRIPQAISDANTSDILFGCTHATSGAPVLAGGVAYTSKGLDIDLGNTLNFNAWIGAEYASLSDREVKSSITLDLTPTQEVAFAALVKANTLESLGFVQGTVEGDRTLLYMPGVQRKSPKKVAENGNRYCSYDLGITPVVGNDELRIVTSF